MKTTHTNRAFVVCHLIQVYKIQFC